MSQSNFPIPSAAMTVDEAANYLSVSRATVWRLLKNKLLVRTRIGGRTVERNNSIIATAAAAIGKTPADVDALFALAKTL
jgi:excisionase family DNA binding protein